jgi:hypothetical protein
MSNKQAVINYIVKYMGKIAPGTDNAAFYKEELTKMNGKEFDELMKAFLSGEKYLYITVPNMTGNTLNIENNLKIGEELGVKFFSRLSIEGRPGLPDHITPIEHQILVLPWRRASQTWAKKVSVPEGNTRDSLTGQVTGPSKGAKISFPELRVCLAMGLTASMLETMKMRGGDTKGGHAFNTMMAKTGRVSLRAVAPFASGVESTRTLYSFLMGMHLNNNLLDHTKP